MLQLGVIAVVFALVFVGELPDKTAIASLILGTRFPWRWVFSGVAVAFLVHVVIAVAAGSLLTLLPQRIVEAVVAVLFLLGAFLIWREGRPESDEEPQRGEPGAAVSAAGADAASVPGSGSGFWKVAGISFGTIFVGEWGDLTQILTANLAAQYHDPLSVGIGATLGLWAVGLLAILGGKTLLKVLPMVWITRVAAVVMIVLGVVSAVSAIRG